MRTRERRKRPPPATARRGMFFSKWRRNSCARSEIWRDVNLDVEPLSRIVLRARCRLKKRGSGELRRLLHQSNEGRRVLGNANDLDLVAFDSEFRHVSPVGQ